MVIDSYTEERKSLKKLIKKHGLELPMKSGCYICPFMKQGEMKKLRYEHPDLFCKAEQMEKRNNERRKREGKKPQYLIRDKPLKAIVEENQLFLFKEDEYPPCECML